MKTNRRQFIGTGSILAGMAAISPLLSAGNTSGRKHQPSGKGLKLSFEPYELQLKHVFTIASFSRKTTPVMLTRIEWEGITGYGEASMPPYLGESHQTAAAFLSGLDLAQFKDPFRIEEILAYVDAKTTGNAAAKASVDIALHDLVGKIIGQPWYKIWGYNPENTPMTTFTIGIDKPDVVREKVKEALPYKILKIKVNKETAKEMVETVRSVTNVPICIDANQTWTDRQQALEMIHWFKEQNVVFVEQPMEKHIIEDMAWLTQQSPLPTIADEALQRLVEVKSLFGVYSGINCKLMKCTGMREAHRMLELARSLGMKLMIGCMTETSCGVSAAAQLSPIVDWADLDGNLLISNDPYKGIEIREGKVTLPDLPGIGITKV